MTDNARLLGGGLFLLTATLLIFYCALSDVMHLAPARWFQRPLLLAPAAVAFLLIGGWLVAE